MALSGNPVPGIDGAVFYRSLFGVPVLNNAGQTAFRAFTTDMTGDAATGRGIWSEGGGGGLKLVARQGGLVPGIEGAIFADFPFGRVAFNDEGQTAFLGFFTRSRVVGEERYGVWSEASGAGLTLVARDGDLAPGTGGAKFSFSSSTVPTFNNYGHTAFRSPLDGNNLNAGIWSEGRGEGLALVARRDDPAPGVAGAVFSSSFGLPAMNDAGHTAFTARLLGAEITQENRDGIWSEGRGADLELIARTGDPAPDTADAVFSDLRSRLMINNDGQVAFNASLSGRGVSTGNDKGIWSEGSGAGLALVSREGDPAPGTQEAQFSFYFSPVINDAGHTVFHALLSGTSVTDSNDRGIWSEGRGEGLSLVARAGDVAPNSSGAVFANFFGTPHLNNSGQTAFLGTLAGPSVNGSNNNGIWAEDLSGLLRLIVRKGDTIDVDNGPGMDLRKITRLDLLGARGGAASLESAFNDLGQLAFRATFNDGTSGIFVSNMVAVPEPNTSLLSLLTTLALVGRFRR